ncbi:MAG: precorrin-3B C(17)-methyltransferase [Methylococcaceae bacterium]|jgi:precorrin-3B C17-methyltransferase
MKGILNLVSVGPGFADMIVPRAAAALQASDVIVAYELYLRWLGPWLAGKEIHTPPLTQERERALLAIEKARGGAIVALISSGDIGIYAMAALAFDEMREEDTYEVNVIPGITSANACAALLGSPLSHDFATLSLSDLLCPWDWIEQRGKHIAQADLACVLYNVQSAGRPEGIYRLLEIMLASKSAKTLCGVVRNAYRPGQSVSLHELGALPSLQFDMLTTIVIGNRFTRRKRGFIFTPRGYNPWDTVTETKQVDALPRFAIWVFSGTSDGNALANQLAADGYPVVISCATEYGAALAAEHCPGVAIWAGQHGVAARQLIMQQYQAQAIIDATHPYASLMSEQLMGLAPKLGVPYLRYERSSSFSAATAQLCDSPQQAAARAIAVGKRIFLATGTKHLAAILQTPGAELSQWFVRVTPEPAMIQQAIALGVPRSQICAMQGPYSTALNVALWRDWAIDCVVTKDSGDVGGYPAKVEASQALGIPILVIARPTLVYPMIAATFDQVLQHVQAWPLAH